MHQGFYKRQTNQILVGLIKSHGIYYKENVLLVKYGWEELLKMLIPSVKTTKIRIK